MKRKIIHIDEAKCNGCGACAEACHEGAIQMINGKAKLTREDYCDGLGDCLPGCPTGAITFEEREAPAYDEEAVRTAKAAKLTAQMQGHGCPGPAPEAMAGSCHGSAPRKINAHPSAAPAEPIPSQLRQWPVQIKLVPVNAPWFDGAKLLIAADCTAYAYGNFHSDFIRGRVTLVGCPKLDNVDYSEKLEAIIRENDIRDITIVRMEVPCCGGLEYAARQALQRSGKFIPWRVVTIGVDGRIVED